jgi:Domain of unknown function (DUF4340)
MRWRQVGVLYLVLAVLAALYTRERPAAPEEGDRSRPPRPRFLQVTAADVTAMRLARGTRIVSVRRDGNGWTVVEPAGAELPNDLVNGFLQALLTTEEIDRIATTTGDLGSFGLSDDADRVELTLAKGPTVVVALGGTNPTGTALYARRDADGGIVLIGRQVRDYQDMIYGALPRGAVPAGTADRRIGWQTPLLLFWGTV